jgi:hypothetical protein
MNQKLNQFRRVSLLAAGVIGLAVLTGCSGSNSAKPAGGANSPSAPAAQMGVPESGQMMFASPEEAAGKLKDAVDARDRSTLVDIFGDAGRQLIFTGDRVQEENELQDFSNHMNESLRVERAGDNRAILRVGKENWPFPIPLVKSGDQWFFDTVAGKDELLNRQIGEDELNAIAVCRAYVAAQKEYARADRTGDGVAEYAQHIMSHAGKKDGLYWEVAAGEDLSPMGPLVAEARMEGYPATRPANGKPHPYHGYFFHILTAQGDDAPGGKMSYIVDGKMTRGFAMVARPSVYGTSGIMTFIVGKDGKVYQKNLGENTTDTVKEMTEYNPDKGWEAVTE